MQNQEIEVKRHALYIVPEKSRVLIRQHVIANPVRVENILKRVRRLSEEQVEKSLASVLSGFKHRHRDIERVFERHCEGVCSSYPNKENLSPARRLLIGAYFTCEYSLEAAALFNPSIVPHPDQSAIPTGALRFIISLRATGEGHISSIEFRTGVVNSQGTITIDSSTSLASTPDLNRNPTINKAELLLKLKGRGVFSSSLQAMMRPLRRNVTLEQLHARVTHYRKGHKKNGNKQKREFDVLDAILKSNYEVRFSEELQLSERVIFPFSTDESNGMEDARFVRFVDDEGKPTYYATYTAYNGRTILPKLLETEDFLTFRVRTLAGKAVENKGMALFPRKIRGKYFMISRQDGEKLYIMVSSTMHRWNGHRQLLEPTLPWEYVQIGNCGSPIETEQGWILLTHGVGPMRKYCIGAILLDKDDPSKVIGQLHEPLIAPNENEREGYVPNVVYTCGALQHNGILIIPYAMSDYATSIASISVDELISKMW
ncbi:MAG: glycoside hydrolase family 130 protein [Ignavibacteriales bacterium]|nr:glycoside hydrolase family 130 protein [Ignavibacteriales bacterium]